MCSLSILEKNVVKAEIIPSENAAAMPHCNFDSNLSNFHSPLHAWVSSQAASSVMHNVSQESSWSAGEM